MNITLSAEAQAIVEREIGAGHFSTQEDVVIQALKLLDREQLVYDTMGDPKVIEAIGQSDRGEIHEWNDELRAQIRRDAMDTARLGKPITDDIKY